MLATLFASPDIDGFDKEELVIFLATLDNPSDERVDDERVSFLLFGAMIESDPVEDV